MSETWDAMATVGSVARPHGIRGQVVINPETDFPEARFAVGQIIRLKRGGRVDSLVVASMRLQRDRPVVGFEDVDTVDGAEALRGAELRVPEDALVELPSGSFYHHDLIGCRVSTVAGQTVGGVVRVDGSLAQSWLVVDRDGDEALVPLVDDLCVRIDTVAREIVVDPPDGLLDVNAPGTARPAASVPLEIR